MVFSKHRSTWLIYSPLQHLKDNIMSKGFSFEIMEQYNPSYFLFLRRESEKRKTEKEENNHMTILVVLDYAILYKIRYNYVFVCVHSYVLLCKI